MLPSLYPSSTARAEVIAHDDVADVAQCYSLTSFLLVYLSQAGADIANDR